MEHSPTVNRIRRVTKGGRQLSYVLTVIQQPERARACGSGAKYRRPVDPPPIIELKIYNEDASKPEDITFAYEANFFLFVTLEAARPLSRGRLHQQQHQSTVSPIPILTGMPVSGMAYLDRPSEAGYFIFPDLSVRHEGHYVLSFNLYEETKNESDHDADKKSLISADPHSPDSSFDWRLEVKSVPFTVFSAKKFPGLRESTHLSRIVAEQGCRVRIRRDVRMRRRDQKSDEHTTHEDYIRRPEEETTYEERTRSQSLSGSSDSSRFSQAESGHRNSVMSNLLHHHHPPPPPYSKQTSVSRPRVKLSFVDHLHTNTSPSSLFPAKSHPRSLAELPPVSMKPYQVSSTTNYNPLDRRPRLPPVRYPPHSLNPGENYNHSRESDAAVAISSAVTDWKSNSYSQDPVTGLQPFNYRSSARPPTPPKNISILKLLSPIKIPSDDTHVSTIASKSNTPCLAHGDLWSEGKGENSSLIDSPQPIPECKKFNNKRPVSPTFPQTSMSNKTRLIHGQRLLSPRVAPLSPPLLPRIVADEEETDEMEKMMTYKRASGEIKMRRGLPIFS